METTRMNSLDQKTPEDFSTYLQHERWTRPQVLDYQASALQACREYAYTHSPFYQRFHRGLMDRPLQDLPVLTKTMLMDNFDDLVTDRTIHLSDVQQYLAKADASKLFLDRYRVMVTSGSTGQPAAFLLNQSEGAIMAHSYARPFLWGGITLKSRAASVGSHAPAHFTAQAQMLINGQPVSRIHMSAMDPLETLVQRLNEWQPDVLLTYISMVSTLANEQRQGRLHISPRAIFCAGETVLDNVRRRIEEVWEKSIFNAYASTEAGTMAAECEVHQGMHLLEDFSILEVVDQDNHPVPPGTPGARVLLTVLYRRTQPLIRYEVSDLVRTSSLTSCPCGRPFALLESVQGRTSEMLYLSSPSGRKEGITAAQFETVFDVLPVSGWQVVQEHDGLHVFLTGASDELNDEYLCNELQRGLSRRGVIVPNIEIHRVTNLYRNSGGKAPMLISHVPTQAS